MVDLPFLDDVFDLVADHPDISLETKERIFANLHRMNLEQLEQLIEHIHQFDETMVQACEKSAPKLAEAVKEMEKEAKSALRSQAQQKIAAIKEKIQQAK
ncbi:MAG: hypothetical protein AB7J40_06415 [Candidatus Altimarinota bacterium]